MVRDVAMAFKILLLSTTLAAAVVLFHLEIVAFGTKSCISPVPVFPLPAASYTDLDAAFREMMGTNWLSPSHRAVSVGPESGPVASAMRKLGFRAVVSASATSCCGLPFEEDSFDFAFSASLDRVLVPARVVLEMERVIRPGRFGAVFRRVYGPVRAAMLMRAAAPVASLLRSSDVVGARALNGSAMVVFRKRFEGSDASAAWGWSSRFFGKITKAPLDIRGIVESVKSAALLYELDVITQSASRNREGEIPLMLRRPESDDGVMSSAA